MRAISRTLVLFVLLTLACNLTAVPDATSTLPAPSGTALPTATSTASATPLILGATLPPTGTPTLPPAVAVQPTVTIPVSYSTDHDNRS